MDSPHYDKNELNQIQSKIEKLISMQRRGTENEKEIASKLLSRLSKKYNIDISKFDNQFKRFDVSLNGWRLSLIIQICAVVCGVDNFNVIKEKYGRKHLIECTEANWL